MISFVRLLVFATAVGGAVPYVPAAMAQTATPGPTNPGQPSNPSAKGNKDLVINPTEEECRKGWHSGLRWTKEEFDNFCGQLKSSK
jgi:hypothetical protein